MSAIVTATRTARVNQSLRNGQSARSAEIDITASNARDSYDARCAIEAQDFTTARAAHDAIAAIDRGVEPIIREAIEH